MELKGTVRNVVDFGAFVDVGVHQDGLVHISKLANRFVKHPSDVVRVGDDGKGVGGKGRSRPQEDLPHHGAGEVARTKHATSRGPGCLNGRPGPLFWKYKLEDY